MFGKKAVHGLKVKLELEIPEWALGKHIYVFAGRELLAVKEVRTVHENGEHVTKYLPLKVKVSRCNGCGDCCFECPFAGKNGCTTNVPFDCVRSICSSFPNCTERFVEMEGVK